ncbi:MAG: amine dehydrogenase [Sphingomonadales bacterium]|nr:amine dehydrogenase [Sphingomonadales bacterium]
MRLALLASGLCLSAMAGSLAVAAPLPPPLPEEPIPSQASLPADYPQSWALVQDFNFNSIVDGRTVVVDTANPVQPLKGIVRTAQFGNTLFSPGKHEIYTAETFYSRLTQGERIDVITVWDTATLRSKGEIVLPGGKRQQSVTYQGTFQFTNGQKWALVSNFTPAQSVTVVDLDGRKVLGEIDLPGCAHIYPSGERGFTTLCADGSLTSIALDDKGAVASSKTVAAVQDIDNQPLFGDAAWIGKTAWFVSYHGQLRGIDMSGPVAAPLTKFLSVGTADGGTPEWRPGGWQVIAADAKGLLYVLMSPAGKEGSHKDGGTEVWVVDPASGKRTMRIALPNGATSIAVTREAAPRLIAMRMDGPIDVIDAASGKLVHSLGSSIAFSPTVAIPVP